MRRCLIVAFTPRKPVLTGVNPMRIFYLKIKLAPTTLASCWQLNDDMNYLTWHLVLPKYHGNQNAKPEAFSQYLVLIKRLEILDIKDINIENACAFLDKAYDFTNQADRPPKFTGF